jgi:hypothetical protein
VAVALFLARVVNLEYYTRLAQLHALGFHSLRAQAQVIAEVTGNSATRIYQVLLFIRDRKDINELIDTTVNTLRNE